jgi:fumarate hydratase class II
VASTHNAERASKSASVKIVKMNFSEDDLNDARLARLKEINDECKNLVPEKTIFLAEIASILGLSDASKIQRWADKVGATIYRKVNNTPNNKKASCVSEEDAEKIIRLYHESRHK